MTNYDLISNQVKAEIEKINPDGQSFIEENNTKTFCFETIINDTDVEVCVNIMEEYEYLRIALQLPLIVPIDKRVEVANYFFEQNEYLSYGTFLFSIETGRVGLKSDINFQHLNFLVNEDYFSTLLEDCIELMNSIYPALMQLIYSSLDTKFLINRFVGKRKVFYN
jgi:hypothetical protein